MAKILGLRRRASQRTLLSQADFTYIGSFRVPSASGGGASDPNPSLAFAPGILCHRYVDGVLRFGNLSRGVHYFEFNHPGSAVEAAANDLPLATVQQYWGDAHSDIYDLANAGVNGNNVYGMTFDPLDNSKMYSNFGGTYGGSSAQKAVGLTTFNDAGGTLTQVDSWSLDGVTNYHVRAGSLWIPQAFANANCSGRRLGVGFGSLGWSTVAGSSAGPAMYAVDPPAAEAGDLPKTRLMLYPFGGTRARRDPDYTGGIFGTAAGGTSNTITLSSTWYAHDQATGSDIIGLDITIDSGTGDGQTRTITGYSGH